MAEEDTEATEEESSEEAEKLEQLLDGAEEGGEGEDGGDAGEGSGKPSGLFSSPKKVFVLIGGGALILALAGGGAYYYFAGKSEEPAVVEQEAPEPAGKEAEPPVEPVSFEKANVFSFSPFFLPLKREGRETGRFLVVTPNLKLSNDKLDQEIERILPLLRKNIYGILSRKDEKDFMGNKSKTEERIKKEILTTANALLLSGKGTVTDVFYTQFVIK